MSKLKKRGIPYILTLMFILSLTISSAGAVDIQPQASSHIKNYSATIKAVGNGKVSVTVIVQAVSSMTKIGATTIRIEQSINNSAWTSVKTYQSSSTTAMLSSGSSYSKTPVTYQGTKGYRYRAVVTCYAYNGTSDSKVYTTSAVTAS